MKPKSYLSIVFPLFLPKSSNIKEPLLQPFRATQADTFTYPGRLNISSRSKSTLHWKKSLKKNYFIIFVKEAFRAIFQKCTFVREFMQKYDFFQKIKIDVQTSQKLFLVNETRLISILLNTFSLWYKWFWVAEPFENPMYRNIPDLGTT